MDNLEEDARKEKLAGFFKSKKIWIILGIIVLLTIAWHTRTGNVANLKDVTTGDYTLGPDLDPFLFLRYAKIIFSHGSLPSIDNFRYIPLGYNTAQETQLLPYMIAYFHKIYIIFTQKSINYSAVMFPVYMFLLTVIAFFLFIRKVFEDKKYKNIIAFVSSLFLIVSPSLVSRTVAGIPEKESAGFFFLFLALYFFLYSWKEQKMRKSLVLGFLAGLSTALMGLIWGGWIYIFIAVSLFVFINFIFNEINKRRFYSYGLWFLASILIPVLFSARFTIKGLATSTSSGLSFILFFLLLVDFIIFNTNLKNKSFIEKLRIKVPDRILSVIIAVIIGLILGTIIIGPSFITGFAGDIIEHLTQPYSDRLSFTVAENRQPYFSEWKDSFGPTSLNLLGKTLAVPPLFFWLFFIGSIMLFYETVKHFESKERKILILLYTLFLSALIFSRYSPSSTLNGANFLSEIIYFGSFALIAIAFIQIFYKYHKEKRPEEFKKLNYSYLFLLAYFIPGLIGARSAIRLIMALAPVATAIVGFFVVYIAVKALEKREEKKNVYLIVAGIVIIIAIFTFYYSYNVTVSSANQMIPSAYTQQWQKAMSWVRTNTSQDAVFAHWWDYGYWVQSIGDRATVLDGGNAIPYWDYLMGRHVLTAQSEREALEFLYTHNAAYLLIDSTDIGKYGAYSRIGSDENYDRYSWIGTFYLDSKSIQEKKNSTVYIYQGRVALDEDYVYNSTKQIFLPARATGVGAVILTHDKTTLEFEQPMAVFVYNSQQYQIPLRYLYYNNKLYDFKNGYEGCMYLVPQVVQSTQGTSISKLGSAMFLSERNMRALWVKLYLLGESDNFDLVYKQDDLIIDSINSNNQQSIGDFLLYYDIRGPIKIWKINYPADIKANPKYLSTAYPDSVRLDTLA